MAFLSLTRDAGDALYSPSEMNRNSRRGFFPWPTARCNVARGPARTLCAWALAVCLLAPGCRSRAADNVLFVSFDTTRADRLSAYGYPEATSPAVASLAAGGTLFRRAYSGVPSTLPAHATMMTFQALSYALDGPPTDLQEYLLLI